MLLVSPHSSIGIELLLGRRREGEEEEKEEEEEEEEEEKACEKLHFLGSFVRLWWQLPSDVVAICWCHLLLFTPDLSVCPSLFL